MMKKILSVAAIAGALAIGLVSAVPAVEAKTSVGIYIGPGWGYWNGPGYYNGRYYDRMTCREGRYIVDNRGFNKVSAIECGGRYYEYRARRNGEWYRVRLDARTGVIVRVRRY